MSSNAALETRRKAAVARGAAGKSVYVARAENAELWDVEGKRYIDMTVGIGVNNTGHRHPRILAAVEAQLRAFTHTCFHVAPYESYIALAERLNAATPGDFEKKTMLVTTGAEAVENAVKIARAYTKRQAVVVFDHGYHGRTNLTMALTAKNMPYKQSFGPFAPEVYRMPMSYPFRDGPHSGAEVASWATTKMEKEIGAANIAAIVIEPIQGEGGFIVPAPGFLPALREFATK